MTMLHDISLSPRLSPCYMDCVIDGPWQLSSPLPCNSREIHIGSIRRVCCMISPTPRLRHQEAHQSTLSHKNQINILFRAIEACGAKESNRLWEIEIIGSLVWSLGTLALYVGMFDPEFWYMASFYAHATNSVHGLDTSNAIYTIYTPSVHTLWK